MISLLVADDQALVRSGFRVILETEPGIEVVGEAEDGADAVDQARRLRTDVVLVDMTGPAPSGGVEVRPVVDTSGA